MTKKERIVATLTGIGLFCVAALFSIGIFLGLLDFGTNKNIGFLAALGQMLVSVYGFCSALIPLFFPRIAIAFRPLLDKRRQSADSAEPPQGGE